MYIQKRIEDFWQTANVSYNQTIQRELKGALKESWIRLIEENRPPGKGLEVLDVGTDPVFSLFFFRKWAPGNGHRLHGKHALHGKGKCKGRWN